MGCSGESAADIAGAHDEHIAIARKNINQNARSHLFLVLLVASAIKVAIVDVIIAAADEHSGLGLKLLLRFLGGLWRVINSSPMKAGMSSWAQVTTFAWQAMQKVWMAR